MHEWLAPRDERVTGRPWLWHALFDGTRLCRCPHSRMLTRRGGGR